MARCRLLQPVVAVNVALCGRLWLPWLPVARCGWIWLAEPGWGYLWPAVASFGGLRLAVAGSGWLWLAVAGCGWLGWRMLDHWGWISLMFLAMLFQPGQTWLDIFCVYFDWFFCVWTPKHKTNTN